MSQLQRAGIIMSDIKKHIKALPRARQEKVVHALEDCLSFSAKQVFEHDEEGD